MDLAWKGTVCVLTVVGKREADEAWQPGECGR